MTSPKALSHHQTFQKNERQDQSKKSHGKWLFLSGMSGIVTGVIFDVLTPSTGAPIFPQEELEFLAQSTGNSYFFPNIGSFALITIGCIALAYYGILNLAAWQRWPVQIAAVLLGISFIWVAAWNGIILINQGFIFGWLITIIVATFARHSKKFSAL